MPLFSVIIPVYNRARLITATLESVLAQTFTAYEVIVIDDGSTDATPAVLARYADRVRVLTQANRGAGAARNLGLRHARGDYAVFLDSDDLWFTWTLAVCAQVIVDHEPSVIVSVPLRFSDVASLPAVAPNPPRLVIRDDFLSIGRDMRRFASTVLPLARVQDLRAVGGYAELPIAFEDWDLLLRMGEAPGFASIESPPVLAYRQHGASATRDPRSLYEGARYCVRQEATGCYPGGHARRRERRGILCSLQRFAIIRCLFMGHWNLGYALYLRNLGLFVRAGRWRFILGLPLLPLLRPVCGKRIDPHFNP